MNAKQSILTLTLAGLAGLASLSAANVAGIGEDGPVSAGTKYPASPLDSLTLAVATQGPATAAASHGDLAGKATDPTAPLVQLQIQNVFIPDSHHASGYANQFIVQPVLPVKAFGFLPRSILRPTIPLVTTPDLDHGPKGTTGLGDIDWVYVFALDHHWGTVGLGGAGAIPTATDARLGARKWTLGPSVFYINKTIPKIQFGALAFNTWSLGGAGETNVNQLSIQPIFNYHFSEGWYAGLGDMAWSINWEADNNQVYLPLSVRLGRVFAIGHQHVNAFIQPHWNAGDDIPGQGQWGIKLNLTLLFPE